MVEDTAMGILPKLLGLYPHMHNILASSQETLLKTASVEKAQGAGVCPELALDYDGDCESPPLFSHSLLMLPMNDALRQLKREPKFLTTAILCLALGLAYFVAPANSVMAQPHSPIERIEMGFGGNVVLGKWVPFAVVLPEGEFPDASLLRIETLDGDAVPIRYNQSIEAVGNSDPSPIRRGLIRLGRASGVTVSLLDIDQNVVASRRFSLDELKEDHTFLPATARLTLVPFWEGATGGESKTSSLPEIDRNYSDVVAVLTDFRQLPNQWIGYESVRTMIITPTPEALQIDDQQQRAIEEWVRLGGRLIITGGSNFDAKFQERVLGDLSPGEFIEQVAVTDTGSIELFTQNNEQLVKTGGPDLLVTAIEPAKDRRVVAQAGDAPLLVHWLHGLGKVSFLSLDLTSEPVSSWPGRKNLLSLTIEPAGIQTESKAEELAGGRMSHIGFTDIVGQLRAGMDQFRSVSFITFTLVALLVGVFILAIGPGDFFFLKKITGRMEWTWVTFSLICISFSLLAWFLSTRLKAPDTQVNQVEIIDVDAATGLVRGNLWAHIYSPNTQTYDIRLPAENQLLGELDEGWLSWQGLPGRGMGSMQSRTDLGLYRQPYDAPVSDEGCSLVSIPMQNASTKALHATWLGELDQPLTSGLRQSNNSDALLGTFTNPFDEPIYDFIVLYGVWVYQLQDRPLEPGETIVLEDDLREKTIAGHFTRRGNNGEDEVSEAWDTSSTRLPKITKMMSFFDLIGGETYTQLGNNYHASIDLSEQIKMGRAVVLGQLRDTSTPLTINGNEFQAYDKQLTLIRMVMPVQPRKKNKGQSP